MYREVRCGDGERDVPGVLGAVDLVAGHCAVSGGLGSKERDGGEYT